MSLGVYNTITKCGDNKGTREYLLRRGHRQSIQVSSTFDSVYFAITSLLLQSYTLGTFLSQHFKLWGIRYLWLSIPTIHTWLWRTNQT